MGRSLQAGKESKRRRTNKRTFIREGEAVVVKKKRFERIINELVWKLLFLLIFVRDSL